MRQSTRALSLLVVSLLLGAAACESGDRTRSTSNEPDRDEASRGDIADLPDRPVASASSEFWDHWGDGRAELSGYKGQIRRYGELRRATATFVYVTEPHDRRTWVKDDEVEEPHRVNVLKLNRALKFQTGIYPYSIMTSVFAPTGDWGRRRFQPTKITMTSQEWCGHVFHGVWPGPEEFLVESRSYFADPGDDRRTVSTSSNTLYQDALPIQLRELDGDFNDGEDWEGEVVPGVWHARKDHDPIEPVDAQIERRETTLDGTPVTRFVLSYADVEVTYDIEREPPRRLLRWSHSNGSHLRLQKTARLPYWRQNAPGDEKLRQKLGLDPRIRESAGTRDRDDATPDAGNPDTEPR